MPSFLTPADFFVRYDYRWVGKQITDTGLAATDIDCRNSSVIAAFIAEASEMVVAAAAVGDRYSENDLTLYGGQLLKRITADLTMGLILKRRARAASDLESLTGPYTEALGYLEQLRRGERIFYMVPDVAEAGLPEAVSNLPRLGIDPPLATQQAFRYFGSASCRGVAPWSPWVGGFN